MTKDELIIYAREQYGTEPEYLWESAPNTFVLRHRGNRKWYAVVMDARRIAAQKRKHWISADEKAIWRMVGRR